MAGFGPEGNDVMSYILDALKKLEHEKTRKSRRDGITSISGALFEHECKRPSVHPGWKIAVAVVIAVLVTFSATWLFLQYRKGSAPSPARLASQKPAAPPVSPVKAENVPSQPESPVAPAQSTPPAAPPATATSLPSGPAVPSSAPQKAAVQAVTATDDMEERTPTKKSRSRSVGPAPALAAPTAASAAPTDIKLSGIAWQEERRARRVVVNGFLMKEGGIISGARITDIFQDRVRFSLSGKTFEIPLISSTVPAAGN
jgi:general secretion pathway protein B